MFTTEAEIDRLLAYTEWLTSQSGSLHTLMDGRHVAVRRRGAGWTWCWAGEWSRSTFANETEAVRDVADYHLSLTTTGMLDSFPQVASIGFQRVRSDGQSVWVYAG